MSTPKVFDFTTENLAGYNAANIDQILIEQPMLYVNHLRIARSIQGWASRMSELGDSEFNNGYAKALYEVAAHLRQGDYVEGGAMIVEQTVD